MFQTTLRIFLEKAMPFQPKVPQATLYRVPTVFAPDPLRFADVVLDYVVLDWPSIRPRVEQIPQLPFVKAIVAGASTG